MLGASWSFWRKQSLLLQVNVWLFILPTFIIQLLLRSMDRLPEGSTEIELLLSLAIFALYLVSIAGIISVLIVGKRLLQTKSGRSRSSLAFVRTEALPLVLPYMLTYILRSIFTLLWGILLVIPGIVYVLRTALFPVVLVYEGVGYREGLKRSKDLTEGKFGSVALSIILLGVVTLLLPQLLSSVFISMVQGAPLPLLLTADLASSIVLAVGMSIYLLSLVQLYAWLNPAAASAPLIHTFSSR